MYNTMILGKVIRDFMDARYIKINRLASGLGVSNDTISNMLNGKRKITATEYFEICNVLEVKPSYFKDLMDSQITNAGCKKTESK